MTRGMWMVAAVVSYFGGTTLATWLVMLAGEAWGWGAPALLVFIGSVVAVAFVTLVCLYFAVWRIDREDAP